MAGHERPGHSASVPSVVRAGDPSHSASVPSVLRAGDPGHSASVPSVVRVQSAYWCSAHFLLLFSTQDGAAHIQGWPFPVKG